MRRLCIVIACLALLSGLAAAQDLPLTAQGTTITTENDIYGQPVLYAEGTLVNRGDEAYSGVSLTAEVYDADDELIGEGYGYLVNACGAGLLPDFALQPGAGQAFAVPLELYEEGEPDRVEILATGTAQEPTPPGGPAFLSGITQVNRREIAQVEWIDEQNLRFGVGCWRDLFTELDWYEYNLRTGVQKAITHPKVEFVTEALRRQLGLLDDLYFAASMLHYAPDSRRMVYQTELNTIITAEPDGSFKRVLFNDLSSRTLQDITWLRNGNFIASYYGAFGDPVLYFTASVDGKVLSEPPLSNPPSLIAPGASPDGMRLVIATVDENGTPGYYEKRAPYAGLELLFEAEPPGNNWPGPLWEQDADGNRFIYAALPTDDGPRLKCFNMQTDTLHDLAPLPLQLATDERASWSLSPENNTIVLAAGGVNGGLWLIDLNDLDSCE